MPKYKQERRTLFLHLFTVDTDNLFKGARFGDNAYYKLGLKKRARRSSMTKEELENSLEEINAQREILLSVVNELEKIEDEKTDFNRQEEPKDSRSRQNLSKYDFRKIMYNAIASGNFQRMLDKIVDGMDLTKVALKSLSDIIEKTKDKLEGNIDEVPGPMGMPIM
ncbi:MAG: hypothetical protein GX892_16120, partial [Thermoanaerobacteraceae bacterium]|nr:hypothetical protein [Thermoanaerobacteraceae bacterium]